jgi:hypothetical protein
LEERYKENKKETGKLSAKEENVGKTGVCKYWWSMGGGGVNFCKGEEENFVCGSK